jgi:hypothetical protein
LTAGASSTARADDDCAEGRKVAVRVAAADEGQGFVDAGDLPAGLSRTAREAVFVIASIGPDTAGETQRSHAIRLQRWSAEGLVREIRRDRRRWRRIAARAALRLRRGGDRDLGEGDAAERQGDP